MKRPGIALGSLCKTVLQKLPKALTTAVLSAALILPTAIPATVQAESGNRTLKLYFIHTKEKAEITFKRNGRYDQRGLKQILGFAGATRSPVGAAQKSQIGLAIHHLSRPQTSISTRRRCMRASRKRKLVKHLRAFPD